MKQFLVFVLLLLASCSDTRIHAQSGSLSGSYIFKSQGFHGPTPFFEAGIVTFKPDGTYHVSSTYNSGGEIQNTEQDGIYHLLGNSGDAFARHDAAALYTTDDHSLIYAVGVTRDSTWLAELHPLR